MKLDVEILKKLVGASSASTRDEAKFPGGVLRGAAAMVKEGKMPEKRGLKSKVTEHTGFPFQVQRVHSPTDIAWREGVRALPP